MSTEKILVGIDLSPESEQAAAHAIGIARRRGAEVVLVHVGYVPEPVVGIPESMRATAETYGAVLRARLAEDRARLETLRQRLIGQGVEISHVVVDGFADAALADTARELGADLIAMGTHGRTGMKRLLLGSVAERTVRLASSSVLVARGAVAMDGGYRRIVVGTDFSPLADVAIARAMEVAADGAHVHVLHAWQLPATIAAESLVTLAALRDALAGEAQQRGAELLRTLHGRGRNVTLELEIVEAPASQALLARAETIGADLLVVGSHGRRGVRRLLLGSVAEATVRHAPCSVLVARGKEPS